jgi:hypothetical protein
LSVISFPFLGRGGSKDAASLLALGLVESLGNEETPRIASFRMSVFNCMKDKMLEGKYEQVIQDNAHSNE